MNIHRQCADALAPGYLEKQDALRQSVMRMHLDNAEHLLQMARDHAACPVTPPDETRPAQTLSSVASPDEFQTWTEIGAPWEK